MEKIAIIKKSELERGRFNMVGCKCGDILLYTYTTEGEDDPVCDMYLNIRTGQEISSIILFETSFAKFLSKNEINILKTFLINEIS